MTHPLWRCCATSASLTILTTLAFAERPACYKLLPSKTLAYVRIADVKELGERFNDTSIGRMAQEQQLKSLTSQLFDEAENAFNPVAEEIGLSLQDLLSIPAGEIAFAVTAPPRGFPAPVLMVDIVGQEANAIQLLDVIQAKILEEGDLQPSTEVISGTKVEVFSQDKDDRFTGLVFFRRDGMQVVTSNLEVAKQILAAWDGDDEQQVLEDNEDFADVMRRSKGPREAVPQLRWYLDPISFAKVAFRGNMNAQLGLSMLPAVGLDGLLAIGGSITLASDEYDGFTQTHIITVEPRTGILAALALKSGSTTPETWVPHDVASYMTLHWDFEQTGKEVTTLYNSFRGDEAFQEQVLARANEALGMDVMENIIGAMEGRVSFTTWYPKPVTFRGAAYLGGIHIQEDVDFEETWKKIRELTPDDEQPEEKSFGGYTIYSAPGEEVDDTEDPDGTRPPPVRVSFALVENCMLISNRPEYIERAIVSSRSSGKSLKNELDFKLVASKSRRQPGGRSPGFFSFQRPEEGIRVVYELATAEKSRARLANAAEGNEFLSRINRALEDNPLPPFAKLREYLAPNGSIITADDTGFHYVGFGLRRK